ncbi:MAG: pyruvate kinase [Bacteroidaceae bacterium]|nr:pyruvate kinase [Bacteroidaceae bacterium]
MMLKKTKIVASISDLRCDVDFLRSLFEAGMNVVRINTAHATPEGMKNVIDNVRAVSNRIAILIDTKGPEVRTTGCAEPIEYVAGDKVRIMGNPGQDTVKDCICVSYPDFVKDLEVGRKVLFDDGELSMTVMGKTEEWLEAEVDNNGVLGSHKSVNVPGVRINLPSLTEKDRRNIDFAIEQNIDFIAHSFVRNKQDVLDIKEILDDHHSDIKIIAKIENQEGVDNIEEILAVADGVMVARGDLGIEVRQELIPGIQRLLIKKAIAAHKPVIVATQMLNSMIKNPRPTRAEVTDVANAVFSRTDAIMLSGETAYGKYPLEAVRTMATIAKQAEQDLAGESNRIPLPTNCTVTEFLAKQAVKASVRMPIKRIITDCYSGRTARNLAAFRGNVKVLALCYREKATRQLALSYGVEAVYLEERDNGQDYYFAGLRKLLREGVLQPSDLIVYLSSGKKGTQTSFLEINKVDDVIENAEDYVLPNSNRYL